jgi:hypothetical protein
MGQIILEVVLGAIVAIIITIVIENLRKPRLKLRISHHHDNTYPPGRPATQVRFLAVDLYNRPLPRIFRWMSRSAALHCHGSITFHHLDGQNVFGRSMPIRWSGSPEPVPIHFQINNTQVLIADPTKLSQISRVDVYPGETQRLDIAAKFDNDQECYGWSNESYFSNPVWRNPDWELAPDRYLVNVTIVSSGEKVSRFFRLVNDVPRSDTRLDEPLPEDRIHE